MTPRRLRPEGLSAAVGNLHRAGDRGAGAARARHPDRLAAPPDRQGDPPGAPPDRGADVLYLPEYLYREPLRVWRGWRWARRCRATARRGAPGSPISGATRRRTASAASARRWCWRAELPADIGHLHAHFLHTPASVDALRGDDARARLDASRRTPRTSGRRRTGRSARSSPTARWAVTCTATGHRASRRAGAGAGRVAARAITGSTSTAFPPAPPRRLGSDGATGAPVTILSVGRAVAKKGYDDLLAALALLPRDAALALRPYRRRRAAPDR